MRTNAGLIAAVLAATALAGPSGNHHQASGAGANDGTKRKLNCKCGECKSCVRSIEAAKTKRARRARATQQATTGKHLEP
jgi:erythromycin esterase-like protein